MTARKTSRVRNKESEILNQEGLQAYEEWNIERAVKKFRAATEAAPEEADYYLNLARALSRGGDFDHALKALAEFLRLKPDSPGAERFELLFASGLDDVESVLTEKMTEAGIPIEQIGPAMQMWLEYRIAIGKKTLIIRKPEAWAAALDYTVRKVNLQPTTQQELTKSYGISARTLRDRFNDLVTTLDIMPCDYRYFIGEENPLDKLVEAAELLERLETQFREP